MATRGSFITEWAAAFLLFRRSPCSHYYLDEKNVAVKKGSRSLLQVPEANGADKVAFCPSWTGASAKPPWAPGLVVRGKGEE